MPASLLRTAFMLSFCTGLLGCSQPASRTAAQSDNDPGRRARLCIAEGQPGQAGPANPWAITVSSEGGICPHVREWASAGQRYDVLRPPLHGELTQEARDGRVVVSYRPERGYVGSDSFALHYKPRNVSLPYLVGVIP